MERRRRAAVVVLGDIGRSPRMQYHALSLADQAGLDVDVVAYAGSEPHAALVHHPRIRLHLMRPPLPQGLPHVLYLLTLPLKNVILILKLFWMLFVRIKAPDFFIVQNPPSIPILTVVHLACKMRKSAFLVDWHNFGYTILGLSLGTSHPFVKLYLWYERHYGRKANAHLCVTKAMQHELAQKWGIQATVLYDRSPEFFHPTSLDEKHEIFCRLQQDFVKPVGIHDCCSSELDQRYKQDSLALSFEGKNEEALGEISAQAELTLFTGRFLSCNANGDLNIHEKGQIWMREDRPAFVVSSTSWTADEDFGMLLEAAVCYDCRVGATLGEQNLSTDHQFQQENRERTFPKLLILVTGKGPMREEYERKIRKLRLRYVALRTMWVSAKDYPLLLGSADLGVCLHTSSSGLDLPMKVVDMFGCGVPVCAVSYSCIGELVKDRVNGLLFSSSSELADHFLELFKDFPKSSNFLSQLKYGALASGSSTRWSKEWENHVLPLIKQVGNKFH